MRQSKPKAEDLLLAKLNRKLLPRDIQDLLDRGKSYAEISESLPRRGNDLCRERCMSETPKQHAERVKQERQLAEAPLTGIPYWPGYTPMKNPKRRRI